MLYQQKKQEVRHLKRPNWMFLISDRIILVRRDNLKVDCSTKKKLCDDREK